MRLTYVPKSMYCHQVLLALGSNLGDRAATLQEAVDALRRDPGMQVDAVSNWVATQPIGGPQGQGGFLNGAVRLRTAEPPEVLWERLRALEHVAGRRRRERWGARTLDIDILLYGTLQWHDQQLEIPHPRMAYRRFVLEPAVQVAAGMRHPPTGWTLRQLLVSLDRLPHWLAIPVVDDTTAMIAGEAARQLDAVWVPDPAGDLQAIRSDATVGDGSVGEATSGDAAAGSTTGRSIPTPLELLDRRHTAVAAGQQQARETGRMLLTGFWLDQDVPVETSAVRQWCRHRMRMCREFLQPTLRVAWMDRVWPGGPNQPSAGWLGRLPGRGVCLSLAAGQAEAAIEDLVAAGQAMR